MSHRPWIVRNSVTRVAHRKGATMIETALILMLLLVMVFGMLDLGLLVVRRTLVANAARQLARQASVHGSMSLSPWGPETLECAAYDNDPIANTVRSRLGALNMDDTTLRLEWPDGTNEPEGRVRATVSMTHLPLIGLVLGNTPWTLTSTTTVQINH